MSYLMDKIELQDYVENYLRYLKDDDEFKLVKIHNEILKNKYDYRFNIYLSSKDFLNAFNHANRNNPNVRLNINIDKHKFYYLDLNGVDFKSTDNLSEIDYFSYQEIAEKAIEKQWVTYIVYYRDLHGTLTTEEFYDYDDVIQFLEDNENYEDWEDGYCDFSHLEIELKI